MLLGLRISSPVREQFKEYSSYLKFLKRGGKKSSVVLLVKVYDNVNIRYF